MLKQYISPAVLSHHAVHFETSICISSACNDTDNDGGYDSNGVYHDDYTSGSTTGDGDD